MSGGALARSALLVFLGGCLGVALRFVLEAVWPAASGAWPWTTFAINLAGAFLLGLLLETLARGGPDEGLRRSLRLGVGTGVLGGFTTYSTFSVEADRLLGAAPALGFAYALVSILAGLVAAGAGMLLAGALRPTAAPSTAPEEDAA
ncbi:CrcB family protein [Agromyces seonyuensis]|uniref:Fluoride-specific ion channel FluC n=1 Tax=Agromyces seonyuensis TaxID=2662446 RepID=A0A6I4P6Y5_9MICO|nr:CrcB family protein [Agromyces seonyuensis]